MSKQPPQRVRVAKLQETQIDAVVSIDLACKQSLHRAGVSPSDLPPRGLAGIAKLTKEHNVLVADADGVVAGYAAWRDESPGVAYLEEIHVKPELQRLGIGTRLLEAVREDVHRVSLPVLVTRCWTKAAAARAFLTKAGLGPLGDSNERATVWKEEQEAAGGVARDGQVVLVQPML
jgi:GNAT superfamily N-acetyltransferase